MNKFQLFSFITVSIHLIAGLHSIVAVTRCIKPGYNDFGSRSNGSLLRCNGHCREKMNHCGIETIRIQVATNQFYLL